MNLSKACWLAAVALMAANAENTKVFKVHNATEFVSAAKEIEYSGNYTVILMNDIDFSETGDLTLIGSLPHFVFDGQGHMIKNLDVKDNGQHAGFIYSSHGAIIRNLVIDSSCTINSNSAQYVGGIIGYCYANMMDCVIENSINMGTVKTTRGSDSRIGGIIGDCQTTNGHKCVIRGCVNYGHVYAYAHSENVFIGGIAGYIQDATIHSSMNYGTITASCKSSNEVHMGGIAGNLISASKVENCVNFGTIENDKCSSSKIGGIAGYTNVAPVKNCYVDEKVGYPIATDDKGDMVSESYTFDENFNVNTTDETKPSLMDVINSYTPDDPVSTGTGGNYFSNCVMNPKCYTVTFYVNNETYLTSNSTFIAMPTFSDGNFDGWYSDKYYQSNFTETTIASDTSLYGVLTTEYTSFNKSAVVPPVQSSSSSSSSSLSSYSSSSSSSSSLMSSSSSSSSSMESSSSSSSSSMESSSSSSIILSSSSSSSSSRTDSNSSSSFSSTSLSSSSYSQVQPTKTVEIVFDRKDISTEEIKEIIKSTADCTDCFEIKVVETEGGLTSVIIRFKDSEQAMNFVETISTGSGPKPFEIKWKDDEVAISGSNYIVVPTLVISIFYILF